VENQEDFEVQISAIVVTVSDSCSQGLADDVSGAVLVQCLSEINANIVARIVVSDDLKTLINVLKTQAARSDINLILTTGGTGFAPRDNTPEATRAVIEREAVGIAEAMRLKSLEKTPTAMLSRAVCGIHGSTLIVNFPGSPKAVRECFDAIKSVLPHAVNILAGNTMH
jgi:molybdenum cofactor synthesis domain-containing protein